MSRATTAGGRPEVSVPEGRRLRQLADIEVGVLRGVGEAAGRELGQLGIATVLDLLTYYPRRYIDGSRLARVGDLAVGESASVLAEVRRVRAGGPPRRGGRGRPSRVELVVGDATGSLPVVFFNQSWRAGQLPVGTLALFFGKLGSYRDAPQLVNPVVEVVRSGPGDDGDAPVAGRIFAVYPLSEKSDLTSMRLSRYAAEALDRAGAFADPLDDRSAGRALAHRPHDRLRWHPPPGQRRRPRPGPAAPGLRRALPPAAGPRAPTGAAAAGCPGDPPRRGYGWRRRPARRPVRGRAAVRADGGPAPGHG